MYYLWQTFCTLSCNKTVHMKRKKLGKSQFSFGYSHEIKGICNKQDCQQCLQERSRIQFTAAIMC